MSALISYCIGCGSNDLKKVGGKYRCSYCNMEFGDFDCADEQAMLANIVETALRSQQEEEIAKLRSNLHNAVNAEIWDDKTVIDICRSIQQKLPEDFMSAFYILICAHNQRDIKKFLNRIDSEKFHPYIDLVLKCALRHFTSEIHCSVNRLIECAYKGDERDEWIKLTEKKAKQTVDGIFDPLITRDVFIAYKSEDWDYVDKLVEYLEKTGLKCYVSERNLPKSVALYDEHLKTAIGSCRSVVFVSSLKSRTTGDARKKELRWIMDIDYAAYPHLRPSNSYGKIPIEHKKPRVEYIIEDYKTEDNPAETFVKNFFDGYQRKYSPESVAESLFEQFELIGFSLEASVPAIETRQVIPEELRKKAEELERQKRETEERAAKLDAREKEIDRKMQEERARKEREESDRKDFERKERENAEKKQAEAQEWFKKGVEFYNKEQYAKAVKWCRKAAEQGFAHAQFNLGVCYDNGQGVQQDYAEAVKWYRKAAEQGVADAQNNLGVCYDNGQGVQQDYAEAVKWYRKAAEQGDADAQNNLGECYYNGRGVQQDYAEAVKWYREAAEREYVSAQYNLGECYEYGLGVQKNKDVALMWYRKAEARGCAKVKNALARLAEKL